MQSDTKHRQSLILAVAPTTRGFGFCAMEIPCSLVDWGSKSVKGQKNVESVKKVRALVEYFRPSRIVLQDLSKPDCRRADRILKLNEALISLAKEYRVKVA